MSTFIRNTFLVRLALLCLLVCGAQNAMAVCVTNAGQLQTAFDQAKQQKQPYTIQIAQGMYALTGNIFVDMATPTTIEGGYNAQCTARTTNPANTVIDFGGGVDTLDQYMSSPKASLVVDGITFINAASLELTAGAYQNCFGCKDNPGELRVSNSRFTAMAGNYGGADGGDLGVLSLGAVNGVATLINVQFDHITEQNGADHCEIAIHLDGDTSTTLEYVTADLSGGKDFCLVDWDETGDHHVDIYNSIFWASDGTLGGIRGTNLSQFNNNEPINVNLVNNLYRAYFGIGPSTSSGQQFPAAQAPLWINPAGFNYALAPSSATGTNVAINTGAKSVPKGNPLRDIVGNFRSIGSAPDLGAYESPYNDADLFTVTNTSDCANTGCGSLRDAINQATISNKSAVTIRFAIPDPQKPQQGLCPAVINLNSPLPDITKSILIDGYTQSPATPNSDTGGAFNATLCVVVQPGNNSPYYGFRVPASASNASLRLSGIAVGDFPVGVELLGGANHQIVGNQFGGLIDNYSFQLYGSSVANIYMDVASGQTTIGGSDPASRNVFLNTSSFGGTPASAINIGFHVNGTPNDCQIVGNMIGLQADGTFNGKNTDYGIYVQGSGCTINHNRIAGVYKDAIYIDSSTGGGNKNVVQNNVLGLAQDIDPTTSNGGAGIRVNGSHNLIGYAPIAGGVPTLYGNYITNMDAGGVVIASGNGNTIRGNWMVGNGIEGDGMSIDLGGDGPNANDYADGDSGPNNRQNYPTLNGIIWPTAPKPTLNTISATLTGKLSTAVGPGFYQVDAYYSHGCNATGHGTAEQWVGSLDFIYIAGSSVSTPISIPVVIPGYDPNNGVLSLTATNNINGEGSTSELGTCFAVDTIFKDGADGL